jgi:hypothetical protein
MHNISGGEEEMEGSGGGRDEICCPAVLSLKVSCPGSIDVQIEYRMEEEKAG